MQKADDFPKMMDRGSMRQPTQMPAQEGLPPVQIAGDYATQSAGSSPGECVEKEEGDVRYAETGLRQDSH